MAVRIRVLEGSDKGKEIEFDRREVRIGRDVGCDLVLTDDAVSGHLRVWFENNTYQVENNLKKLCYFLPPQRESYEKLPVGGRRVWLNGHVIQPAQNTLLALYIEEGTTGGGTVVSQGGKGDPNTPAGQWVKWGLAVLLLVIAGWLWVVAMTTSTERVAASDPRQEYALLEEELRLAHEAEAANVKPWVETIRTSLKDARRVEIGDTPNDAFKAYIKTRDDLTRVLGAPTQAKPEVVMQETTAQTLRRVRDFVSDRVIDLNARRTGR